MGIANGAASNVESWLRAVQVSREFGMHVRVLSKLAAEGKVRREKNATGTFVYCPEDVLAFQQAQGEVEQDAHKTEVVLSNGNDLLKQAHGHIEKMFAPAMAATNAAQEMLRQANADLRAENSELRKLHLDLVKAREEMLNDAHSRELAGKMWEASEARKQKVFGVLAQGPLPKLLSQVMAAFGLDETASGQTAAAIELLKSLEGAQLEALLMTDFVTDEQKELIRKVMAK